MKKLHYFNDCVGWEPADVHAPGGLVDMIDSRSEITRRTFCRRVSRADREALERRLGYWTPGCGRRFMTCNQDYHVSYYRGRLHGRPAVWMEHSAIERVFTHSETEESDGPV